jgi:hypothetical protein
MKKLLIAIYVFVFAYNCSGQNKTADSLLLKLSKAKSDSNRIGYMNKILYEVNALSPQDRIDYSKKILDLSKKQNDKVDNDYE